MSLILDALKKLEREKETGARGFVVLSQLPWAGAQSRRATTMTALAALVAIAAASVAFWRWHSATGVPAARATAPALSPPAAPAASDPGMTPPSGRVAPPGRLDTRPVAVPPLVPPASLLTTPKPTNPEPDPSADAPAGQGPTAGKVVELRLHAISVKDGHPVAILNDRLVREGDMFDGIRVLRIGDAEVEVEVAGERRTLRF